jgi:NAD(P)-dependent dehydrogenase (short-subunit alcohol dehydrogenase family)
MLLRGKVVVVTGAGGGLGEAIARVCHGEGAAVALADIRENAVRSVAASLGERAVAVRCDVGREADLEALLDAAAARFGRIDGLVNNAGVNFAKPFLETTAEDWDRVLAIDLRAVFLLTRMACRRMLVQRPPGGSIVNISSTHSLAAVPGAGPYDAAKWGVVGLTKAVAVELAPRGVRANVISPGLLDTQIWRDALAVAPDARACEEHWKANIPMRRVIDPKEVGELAAFLLSDRASCITGANLLADAGMTSQLVSRPPHES